nr:hypothetical protein BaRGS_012841 [Batillaria attramentaria]
MARGPNPPGVTVAKVASAITRLGERGGSNLSAIHNVLKSEYSDADLTAPRLKKLLVKGVQRGALRMATGASGGRFVLKIPPAAMGRRAPFLFLARSSVLIGHHGDKRTDGLSHLTGHVEQFPDIP